MELSRLAEWLACGPHHSTAALGQQVCRTEQEQSNKARAKEHLCVSGSGTGSLSQGGVKVEAEMGETKEKKAKRGDGMSSHTKSRHHQVSSVLVLVRRKGSVSGRAP